MEETMTVKGLIGHLQTLDPDTDIYVAVRKGWRPICDLKPVKEIKTAFDQDTAKPSYLIDVDVEPMHRIPVKDM